MLCIKFSARVSLVVFAFAAACSVLPAFAQNSTEDCHIQPRVEASVPKDKDKDKDQGQPLDPSKPHAKPFKVDVNMVLVPVTITDPLNRLVTGLDRENFNLFEGKDQQEIKSFSSEDAPVSIGVIFDMSGSM